MAHLWKISGAGADCVTSISWTATTAPHNAARRQPREQELMIISNRSSRVQYANYTNITGDNDWNIGPSLIDTLLGLNSAAQQLEVSRRRPRWMAVAALQNTVFGKCNNWLRW